jgi:hypothetical protein
MRRCMAVLMFAGCAASPIGAAPLVGERPPANRPQAAVAVQQMHVTLPGIREEVAMVLVGTALIGLAEAVRRAA